MLRRSLRPAVVMALVLCALTGLAYPGIVTVLARAFFPYQADGSLMTRHGRVVGSALIGQAFGRAYYFHPRPSAAGSGYDATASGGSNRGPTDARLADTLIARRIDSAIGKDGATRGRVPSDMVTASASGLDPHISPANARLQAERVAAARGAPVKDIVALLERHLERRQLGLFGEPRVNVLLLNLALDDAFPIAELTPLTGVRTRQ